MAHSIEELTSVDFDSKISAPNTAIIVDFWAPWCNPCRQMNPILETIAEEFKTRVQFYKLNVDVSPQIAQRFEVRGIPTFIFFKNNQVIHRMSGSQSEEELRDEIEKYFPLSE